GYIGADPFAEVFTHPVSAGVPVVVETPGPEGPHARDVATLKELRAQAATPEQEAAR
ncbi:MAG UNVERIFIED_CONTAM: endonuclease IV, partial [Thermobifida fusca]